MSTLISAIQNENLGELAGFSIACMLLFWLMACCSNPNGRANVYNIIQNQFKFIYGLAYLGGFASLLIASLFPQNGLLVDISVIFVDIFNYIPLFLSAWAGALSLGCFVEILKKLKESGSLSTTGKIFFYSVEIYKYMLFACSLVGFTVLVNLIKY